MGAAAWAASTRTYIDRPVGVAAFAPTDPEAPLSLRFVLHPAHEGPPPNDHFVGFCKVGDDKEVAVRRGEAVTITLKDSPELGVTFAPWCNTRQSEMIPRVFELGPSSSHSRRTAVISQPGVVPHQREFPLMLVGNAASAVATASTLASAAVNLLIGRPRSTLLILSCNHRLPAADTEAAAVHALHPSSQRLIDPSAEQAAAAVGAHDWVHFCGHADPRLGTDRVLVWCKGVELDAVAASTLVNMLRGKRLVVLNGCCSDELGCKLIQAGGVQLVVCWKTKLKDDAGLPFAEGFWRAMVGHESDDDATFRAAVRAAFEAGRTALLSVTKPQASALDVGQREYRAANVPKFALADPSHGARTPRGEIAAGVPLLLLCPPLTTGIPAVPDLYYGLTL